MLWDEQTFQALEQYHCSLSVGWDSCPLPLPCLAHGQRLRILKEMGWMDRWPASTLLNSEDVQLVCAGVGGGCCGI